LNFLTSENKREEQKNLAQEEGVRVGYPRSAPTKYIGQKRAVLGGLYRNS